MKHLNYILILSSIVACSTSDNSSIEKVIADFKQTDPKTGQLYDLKFKLIEMGEMTSITVADSIKILEEDFLKENAQLIENYNDLLSMAKRNLEMEKKNRRPSATMIGIHEKDIQKHQEQINEIENSKPDLSKYASKGGDDILAYSVVCSYSMNDLSGNNITEKSEFILSPDQSTIYKARRIMK